MPYCENLCLVMPANFPCGEYTSWRIAASSVVTSASSGDPAWEHLSASNLTAWRFRHAQESWNAIKALVQSAPNGGSHEDQYQMDCEMFEMLTAVISCVESTIYSISAVASLASVVGFVFDASAQKKGSDPTWLATKVSTHPKGGALCTELNALAASAEWKFFLDLRNRVSHRSNLSRVVRAAVGVPLPTPVPFHFSKTSNTPEIVMTIADFEARHVWFAATLRRLLIAARSLL